MTDGISQGEADRSNKGLLVRLEIKDALIAQLRKENKRLRGILSELCGHYIANPGDDGQFIVCITPNDNTPNEYTDLWDKARAAVDTPIGGDAQ